MHFTNIKKDSKLKASINLIIVQFGLYIIPLITMPYIVRTVGIENYGKYVFSQSVMGLLAVIVNYGFIQAGVRDISVCQSNKQLNAEYSNIFYSKLFSFLIAVFLGSLLLFFDKFSSEGTLYLFSFLFLIVALFDVSFVYQGIEKLKDYANVNLIGNVFVLASLFLVIKKKDDYIYLPLVFALPRIAAYLFSMFLLYYRFKIVLRYINIEGVKNKLSSNSNFFFANIAMILYTRTTTVLLGLLTNNLYVGYYALADQLACAYSNLQGQVSATYQPQVSQAFKINPIDGRAIVRESIQVISILAIAGFVFTQFFAYEILYLLFKENANFCAWILRILSLNFISIHISSIFGIQILLSLHKDRNILRISTYAALLNVTLGCALILYFKHIGASISVASIEIMVLLYYYRKLKDCEIYVIDKRLIQKLLKYLLSLIFVLIALKSLYVFLPVSIFIKLPAIIILYGLFSLVLLHLFKMVDFKNRKIIIDASNG